MTGKKYGNLLVGSLCAVGCETIFGFSYIFTKQATENATPLALLGWRFFAAFLAMNICVLLGLLKVDLKGKKIRPVLLLVALWNPVLYFIGETVGINRTTATESGIFLACIPVASLLASALILHKKPRGRQVVGILITLCGVLATVLAAGAASSLSGIGYLFLLLAVLSYALYCVYVDKAETYTSAEITYMMLAAGAAVFITLALLEAGVTGNLGDVIGLPFHDGGFLMTILFQGIGCSVFAFFLSNLAIAKIGVNRTSSFIGIATVVSMMAGVLILGEPLSLYQFLGAVMILAGVYVANSKDHRADDSGPSGGNMAGDKSFCGRQR